ncbi:MAG: sulfide-dependent adenosine diphosphate thiazole synthase [bacterium]
MIRLDEVIISQAIIDTYFRKLTENLDVEVAIVGGGPAGLTAAYVLAREGKRVALFDRKLTLGGGMWGGGMMFNQIVVQDKGVRLLEEFGVRYKEFQPGYFVADAIESVTTICSAASRAGASFFNLISAEDVMTRDDKVTGLVLNWSTVEMTKLHVDPLCIRSRFVVDATGHPAEVVKIVEKKFDARINTPTGKMMGEKAMCAEMGEDEVVKLTGLAYSGLYVCGMAASATFGAHRMGPIFGGMLLSGQRVAELILREL